MSINLHKAIASVTEPEIILKFVRKTFPTKLKSEISNLIRIFFTLVQSPPLVISQAGL